MKMFDDVCNVASPRFWRPCTQLAALSTASLMLVAGCSDGHPSTAAPAEHHGQRLAKDSTTSNESNPGPNWRGLVQKRIANGEYRIRRRQDGEGFRAFNRAHGLRADFDAHAVRVSTSDGQGAAVALNMTEWGRAGALRASDPGHLAKGACVDETLVGPQGNCLKRLEIRHDGIIEWWHNQPAGLEQGWRIARRPAGHGELVIEVAVDGATVGVDAGEHDAQLVRPDGSKLRYAHLSATDATGRALRSHLAATPHGVAVHVDDDKAVYPVMVDPMLTTSAWMIEGDADALYLGIVNMAGDVNNDGYDDVLVGAPGYNSSTGRVFLFTGSATGLSTTPAWSADGPGTGSNFGAALAGAGDVNGDGFDDVIVAGPRTSSGKGQVNVYFGSATGPSATADWSLRGPQLAANFGHAVRGAGDVNGDGFDDVVITSPYYHDAHNAQGKAEVYLGGVGGLQSTPGWTALGIEGNEYFGTSADTAGDVNGDGFDDIVVGADGYYNSQGSLGAALVYLGSNTGLSATAAVTLTGQQVGHFGVRVTSAGDVNGDGFGDIAVSNDAYTVSGTQIGRVYIFLGSTNGVASVAGCTVDGTQDNTGFGDGLSAGDVNGDGLDDILVGARGYSNGQQGEGRVVAFMGNSSCVESTAAWSVESNAPNATLGASLSGTGDVNGDHFADIVVGAPRYENGQRNEGAAFLVPGRIQQPRSPGKRRHRPARRGQRRHHRRAGQRH